MNRSSATSLAALWTLTISLAASQPNVPPAPLRPTPPKINFVDVAEQAGLAAKTEDGGEKVKRYILETTGSGVAAFDFDNDGWPDIFLVNGSRFEGFPKGQEPTSHLYQIGRAHV